MRKTFGNNLPRGDAALPTTGIEIEKFQETQKLLSRYELMIGI
jgi:hypothetical protein